MQEQSRVRNYLLLSALKRLKGKNIFLTNWTDVYTVKGKRLFIIECIEVFKGDEPIFN